MTSSLREFGWKVVIAGAADVLGAVQSLSGHMNVEQRERFEDKLNRYVRKADRDLILALDGDEVLGFYTIIEQDDLAPDIPEASRRWLQGFACCTGLLVHPDCRCRGIGASLHRRGEQWARERSKPGLWLSTRRHADWYRRHFGYDEVGRVLVKGIERTIMAKLLTT